VAGPREANPYQAPSSSVDTEELPASRALPGFTDQRNLVLILTGLLGGQVITGALGAIVYWALFFGELVPASSTALALSFSVAKWHLALYYLTLIPFGWFLVRANKNARVLSRRTLHFTPASMVWWFAVPFLNFVRPYQAVRAVWLASSLRRERSTSNPTILLSWWALWVASTLLNGAYRWFPELGAPELYRLVGVVSNTLVAGLAGTALVMVRALYQLQQRKAAKLSAGRPTRRGIDRPKPVKAG
jgi:hypothetical protein